MKFVVLNKKRTSMVLIGLFTILLLLFLFHQYHNNLYTTKIVMGGQFYKQFSEYETNNTVTEERDVEKYFRPSKLPILNDRDIRSDFFNPFWEKKPSEIALPDYLLKTPDDTIINYYSILRQAANPQKGKGAGCGTLGLAWTPYPVAYNFLSSTYREKLDYNQYLKSFENILHINLIKLKRIATDEKHPDSMKYFVEIETIEGSEKDVAYFAYYYGYLYIFREGNQYKISDLQFYGEDYLCAPYHGWWHDAESVVDITYGGWCSLVKERYPTQQDGFVKKIYFKGTDGNDYIIEFFHLTNDTDLQIAQYKKSVNGKWELIKLDSTKCLEKKASTPSEKDYIKDSFYQLVNYSPAKDLLSFTIPKTIPEGYKFYLHVSGRMYMGNKFNVMSFHAFDEESQNYSWESGKTYTYPLKSENLIECLLVFGLIGKNNQELLYAIHIFPDGTKSIERTD